MTRLSTDPIPNIRFNVAKAYAAVIPILKKTDGSQSLVPEVIKPTLLKLADDGDVDVRFYAHNALALL